MHRQLLLIAIALWIASLVLPAGSGTGGVNSGLIQWFGILVTVLFIPAGMIFPGHWLAALSNWLFMRELIWLFRSERRSNEFPSLLTLGGALLLNLVIGLVALRESRPTLAPDMLQFPSFYFNVSAFLLLFLARMLGRPADQLISAMPDDARKLSD